MKKIHIFTLSALMSTAFASCTDMDQFPEDRLSPENYFNSEAELKQYTNSFYTLMPAPNESFKFFLEQSEHMVPELPSNAITGNRVVPGSGSGWTWTKLRDINYYLQYSGRCKDESVRKHYDGVAYFFRALFYFDKLTRFGEVPWYDKPVGSGDTELLKKPRDSREVIIRHIIEDCDKAYEYLLPFGKSTTSICAWTAVALKSRACLFEGTFRKYHAGDPFNPGNLPYEELLEECAEASKLLMDNGNYEIVKEGSEPYRSLFATLTPFDQEVIWARIYGESVGGSHNAADNARTRGTGYTKRFVATFLNADGTRYTDDPSWKTKEYVQEFKNRDPRLSQTVLGPGYKQIGSDKVGMMNLPSTRGAYQYIKYVMDESQDGYNRSKSAMPIFRLAEVMLNYAEAKAELGTLTQTDLDISVNKIRDRVNMPHLNLVDANVNPDPFLMSEEWGYPNVAKCANTGVILEIRRERMVELTLELVHFNDILRWKEGAVYSKPWYGMYFPGPGKYDLTGDGKANVTLWKGTRPGGLGTKLEIGNEIMLSEGDKGFAVLFGSNSAKRTWDENRDYLFPIPTDERILTGGALTQNPGWEDGLTF